MLFSMGGDNFSGYLTPEGNRGRYTAQLLLSSGSCLGLCAAVLPAEVITGDTFACPYHDGRNQSALPSNLWQKIVENLQESFIEISMEDSQGIPVHINKFLHLAPSA